MDMDSVNVSLALKPNERYIGYRQFGHCVFFALHSLETRVPFDVKKNYKKAKKFSGFHSHLSPTSFQRILSIAEFLGCENQTKMPIQMKKNQKFRVFFLEDIFARVSLSVAAAIKMATRC